MATKKLSDYLTPTLPASGGFQIANSTPAYIAPKPVAAPIPSPLSRLDLSNVGMPPVTGITNQNLLPASMRTAAAPVPAPVSTPGVGAPSGPLFSGSAGPSAAPVGPQGATGAVDPKLLNPDGSYKSADQIASEIGVGLRNAHGNADVGTLAAQQFAPDTMTTAQAEAQARKIGNTRNDIAVGETDPYKIASQSGIAYTPAELKAIENAYAGIYDPALDTALAKVTDKQAADKAKAAADADANKPYTLGKDDVRYDGQGNPIAVGISSTTGAPGGTYTKGTNPVVDAYVTGFQAGTYKASDIPDAYKDLVAQGVAAATGTGAGLTKTSIDALGIINSLQNDPGVDSLSGQGFIGGIEHPSSLFPGTAVQNAQNLAKQLQATISLGNRQQLKGSGAISDFEFKVLGNAATQLGLDENGRTNLSAAQFKDALGKLELKLQVGELKTLTDDEVQALHDKGATPEQIRVIDAQSSFSSAGNASDSTISLNRPQRNKNPGNVKAGGSSDSLAVGVDEQGHLIFPDAATGFKALTQDVSAKIAGNSKYLPANPTIAQLGSVYAEDPGWAKKVAALVGVPVDTHTQTVPLANLVKAIATQEGFYA